jgi:CHAT domain-containing protein
LSWLASSIARADRVAADGRPAGGPSGFSSSEETPLELGKTITRELGGGKSHRYSLALSRGQYCLVSVGQPGVDVAVTVIGPDSAKVIESDHPGGALEEERVAWIAQENGTYVTEVRSVETASRPGPYTITLEELREAGTQDQSRIAARRAFADAEHLFVEGTADSRRRSLAKYQEALALWQQLEDRREEIICLVGVSQVLELLGDLRQALTYCERALSGSRAASDPHREAESLTCMGSVHLSLGESPRAIEYFNQAITLWRAAGYRGGEAQVLVSLGAVYVSTEERQKGIEYYGEALPLVESLGDREGQAATLTGIGLAYEWLGDLQKALDYCSRSLDLIRAVGYRAREAVALNNLSIVYNDLGEHERALGLLVEALALRREAGDRRGEAYTLTSMGRTYDFLGRKEEALAYYNQALPLRRAVGDRRGEGFTLNLRGLVRASLGRTQEASEDLQQAVSLFRILRDQSEEAMALNSLGVFYGSVGQKEKAVETLEEALRLRRAFGDLLGEAVTLYEFASVEARRGKVPEARARLENALAIVESLRTRVGSPDLRATFLATAQKAFAFEVDLCMRLHAGDPGHGFDEAAFAWSERARGRSMRDLLAEAHANIREGIDPALLERERSSQQSLGASLERRMRLLSRPHNDLQAEAANKEIEALKAEAERVQAQVRAAGPRYAALTQPRPLTLPEIQRQLGPDTVLLEYALGEERSFLWVVTRDGLASHELPNRSEIEAAARKMYESVTARGRRIKAETAAQRRERLIRAEAETAGAASALSQMLLAPAALQLARQRLVIVSDGALQYVPFAALPMPGSSGVPLVVDHELASLPSASVLSELRRDNTARNRPSKTLAVLADPVFEKDDERLGSRAKDRGAGPPRVATKPDDGHLESEVLRSAVESGATEEGGSRIARLPFTREEAEAILKLAPREGRKAALDFEASRTTATSPELGQYRFVHFATHGFLNSVHPELSGIVLSLVDPDGAEQRGFLPASEVFNLELSADLVVLSGCQTALGKEIKGEGLVGLTRSFMYAGAPRVVASLWNVDDAATADLMKRFYDAMLGPDQLAPAAALRSAQVAMWKGKRWKNPFYWSGFVLQGEWN